MLSQLRSPLFYTIGNDESIETSGKVIGENVFHIKGTTNNFDFIPEHKVMDSKTEITTHNQITDSGNFNLYADKEILAGISYNYNRLESDLTCLSSDKISEELSSKSLNNIIIVRPSAQTITQSLNEAEHGKSLWKLCVISTLMFLATEILLLRFMKG
jgi:hypothetical protein